MYMENVFPVGTAGVSDPIIIVALRAIDTQGWKTSICIAPLEYHTYIASTSNIFMPGFHALANPSTGMH